MATTPVKINTGRRKEAVARVRLVPGGSGDFTVNGRTLDDYFPTRVHRMVAVAPLRLVGREKDYDVIATIKGGGISGHASHGPAEYAQLRGAYWRVRSLEEPQDRLGIGLVDLVDKHRARHRCWMVAGIFGRVYLGIMHWAEHIGDRPGQRPEWRHGLLAFLSRSRIYHDRHQNELAMGLFR